MSVERASSATGEDGVALVYAILATVIITGVVGVLVSLASAELRDTGRAARFESAIHVAEGGADVVVAEVGDSPSFTTSGPSGGHVYDVPSGATTTEVEAWAVDVATDNCTLVKAGDGEACGIRPVTTSGVAVDVVYGVGFVPSRANPLQTRVVRIEYDRGFFSSTKAVLTDGALTLDGSADVFGLAGSVHTNSDLIVKGSASVEDDLTYSGSLGADSTGKATAAPPETVPDTRAREVYDEQSSSFAATWYDLCPDGTARSPSAGGPCTGTQLWSTADTAEFRGWGFKDTGVTADWSASGDRIGDGVYYVYHGNVAISGQGAKASDPMTMTVLLEAVDADCGVTVDDDGSKSGHYTQTGNLSWDPFLGDALVVADGDLDVRGTPSAGENFSDIEGVMMARQQFDASGNLTMSGSLIAQDICDDSDSPVNENSLAGSVDLEHDGDLLVPVSGLVRVIAWNEL